MELMTEISEITNDTLAGLSAQPKYLMPKYFYDDAGSRIFQNIMNMPEYYLTDCETEIFVTKKQQITNLFRYNGSAFDLIELGSGDGTKTKILIKQLLQDNTDFSFIPVDISAAANHQLVDELRKEIPNLSVEAQTGDYFQVMNELSSQSDNRRVILFLGSNIGNFSNEETDSFLAQLAEFTQTDDQVLIGFDLKKSPEIIIQAYDDSAGYTRRFNLNLLERLNRELDANFDPDQFQHHTSYNPVSGEVKSYLVSKSEQTVTIKTLERDFYFAQWETIFMERSRKYDLSEIEILAARHNFEVRQHFFDQRNYFVDSLWAKK
ncbi:MAG: L-histidine N(alpha)-methyltransferase [Calditrichaceae bacterium]